MLKSCPKTQAHVSFDRMTGLLQGSPAYTLVAHSPLYLRGPLPEITNSPRTNTETLETLEVRDLHYHYPETGRGITDINLRIERGTFTVITGRIGAGKTTLVQTLSGLLPKDGGKSSGTDSQF